MAAESRLEIADLTGGPFSPGLGARSADAAERARRDALADLENFVFANAESMEFFQLVRLLHRIYPERRGVAELTARPDQEVARFGASTSLAFPPGEIASLDRPAGDIPARAVVNFMGLVGPQGVLPLEYTHLVATRVSSGDRVLRDFLDIFHHRMVSLFYRAWEKTHFFASYERGVEDRLSEYLGDLAGVGLPELYRALPIERETLLYYAGLLAPHQRSATALEQLISDYFGVDVSVAQFTGGWYEIDDRTQCTVGEEGEEAGQLGFGAVVGDAVYDPQAGIRIRIGPLSRQRYAEFLPGGSARAKLYEFVRFYTGDYLDIELQLVLKGDDVPLCQLGEELDAPLALGWYTWLPSRGPLTRDPDDTILSLDRG
jgi:type VI secretion system protein ImpH